MAMCCPPRWVSRLAQRPHDVLGGGVLPEHLVHRLGDAVLTAGERGGEPVVGEHQPQRVADPVGGRLVPGGEHHHEVAGGLVGGELAGVGEHPGRHVVAGGGGPFGHQPEHRPGDVLLAA